MPKYIVRSPVKSGGKIHDIGVTVTLDEESAAPLLALGRIEPRDGEPQAGAAENSSDESGSVNAIAGDAAQQAAKPNTPAAKPKSSGKK